MKITTDTNVATSTCEFCNHTSFWSYSEHWICERCSKTFCVSCSKKHSGKINVHYGSDAEVITCPDCMAKKTTTTTKTHTCPECREINPILGESESGPYCGECGHSMRNVLNAAPVEDVIIEDVIILSNLHVHPCIEDDNGITASDTIADSEADFFGVYHIDAEGYEWWVKDFDTRRNAETFIMDLVNNSTI